jgi:hypothetical protein
VVANIIQILTFYLFPRECYDDLLPLSRNILTISRFEVFIRALYIVILPCIEVTKHENIQKWPNKILLYYLYVACEISGSHGDDYED